MRVNHGLTLGATLHEFPFLFGGTFIEGDVSKASTFAQYTFPFLFGGTFIEGLCTLPKLGAVRDFPSFSEGLSLRGEQQRNAQATQYHISLPFRRDFH